MSPLAGYIRKASAYKVPEWSQTDNTASASNQIQYRWFETLPELLRAYQALNEPQPPYVWSSDETVFGLTVRSEGRSTAFAIRPSAIAAWVATLSEDRQATWALLQRRPVYLRLSLVFLWFCIQEPDFDFRAFVEDLRHDTR